MNNLYKKLNAIPNAYFGFVMVVLIYASKSPDRLQKVTRFLDDSKDVTPPDVLEFIADQPDFFEAERDIAAS